MTDVLGTADAARKAYRAHRWDEAYELFLAARRDATLSAEDLGALADSAWWLGLVDESVAVGEESYRAHLAAGESRQAAWAAIGNAVNHLLRGEDAVGSGWIGQAAALLADDPECAEAGYLRYLVEVEGALDGPDLDAVLASAHAVGELGARLGEPNLVAAAAVGEGRVLVKQGRAADGLALLDRAMVAVLGGDLAPDWAGNLYCHMVAACHELSDIRRATQWTEALEQWLATLPSAVVFTGICRVHRSQLMQLTGDWDRAALVAEQVCAELGGIACATAAEGHYQVGELNRLRGRLRPADEAYQRAHRLGRDPQPGLALLRLAQGRTDAAVSAIRAALMAETQDRLARARMCAAQVEIALAAGDPATARTAAAELTETAEGYDSPGLLATAARAMGAVHVAEGNAAEALPVLRAACRSWVELSAPYECAQTRVLLGAVYHELGDTDSAERELAAAAEVFTELGAVSATAAGDARQSPRVLPGGLTEREAEVLSCLAAGRTNKEIAAALVISDKTVQRHLSNIFTKLGLASRTAATAYAFEHGLVPQAGG